MQESGGGADSGAGRGGTVEVIKARETGPTAGTRGTVNVDKHADTSTEIEREKQNLVDLREKESFIGIC